MWMSLQFVHDIQRDGRGLQFFVLWVVWMSVGTIFFAMAPKSDLGFVKGMYMAVNVGYSIGFGYPIETDDSYMLFSSIFVLIGSSFVAVALGFFADKISEDHDNWFTNLKHKERYQAAFAEPGNYRIKFKAFFDQNRPTLRAVGIWVTMIGSMIVYSMGSVGWSFRQAQYFAISTLSTGGLWSLPFDTDDWVFGVTAIFAMFGVPIMGMAMAQVARGFVETGDLDETKETIEEEVTAQELMMLQQFGLEDGDGEIDKAEFIILCMVRMGTDPNLIEYIAKRFQELDEDGGGTLSIKEITGGKYDFVDGKLIPVRRSQRTSQTGKKKSFAKPISKELETHEEKEYTSEGSYSPEIEPFGVEALAEQFDMEHSLPQNEENDEAPVEQFDMEHSLHHDEENGEAPVEQFDMEHSLPQNGENGV